MRDSLRSTLTLLAELGALGALGFITMYCIPAGSVRVFKFDVTYFDLVYAVLAVAVVVGYGWYYDSLGVAIIAAFSVVLGIMIAEWFF